MESWNSYKTLFCPSNIFDLIDSIEDVKLVEIVEPFLFLTRCLWCHKFVSPDQSQVYSVTYIFGVAESTLIAKNHLG